MGCCYSGIPYPCSDGDAFYKRRQQYYQQYLSNNNENTQQALISPVAPPTPIQPVQPVQPKMQFFQNPYTVNPPSEQPQRTYVDIPYPGYSLDPPAKPMFRPTIEQHEEINPTFKPNQIDPSLLNALSPGFYADPNAVALFSFNNSYPTKNLFSLSIIYLYNSFL